METKRKRNFAQMLAAALIAAALSLLSLPASASAEGYGITFTFTQQVQPVTVGTCDGSRLITLSGKVHFVVHFTESASTNQNFRYEINYAGVKGVDQFGNEYIVASNSSDTSVWNADTQSSQDLVQYFRLIGKGQVPNQQVRNVSHITTNNNGQLTAVFNHFDADCR